MIINTRADLDALAHGDAAAYQAFLHLLIGTAVRVEAGAEPDPGDGGLVWTEVVDTSVLERYGFACVAAVEAAIGAVAP